VKLLIPNEGDLTSDTLSLNDNGDKHWQSSGSIAETSISIDMEMARRLQAGRDANRQRHGQRGDRLINDDAATSKPNVFKNIGKENLSVASRTTDQSQ